MHDTFLNERIYNVLLKLCEENFISRLNKITVIVNPDSHISGSSLYEYFKERNSDLAGDWTEIAVEKQNVGKMNAVIKSIEGEAPDD
ncbi:hypothetical protein [Phosphitispora sp. TUW77]|uniref:hypothetical protein n=1 Tax=Phosphitispora sp. TUW77 TaxID=3152361 RepID=UPI003AB4B638